MSDLTESDFAALEERAEEIASRGRDTRFEKRRTEDKWRLDKSISPALIVTAVTFIVSGVMAYADLKRNDDLLKAETTNLHALFTHMEKSEQESLDKISAQYDSLSAKVDRLIERQIPRQGSK